MSCGFGGGDDLQGVPALGMVLREELGRSHEHRAGQAPLTELQRIAAGEKAK
jgi:hypothetical protein